MVISPFFIFHFFVKPCIVDLGRGAYILNACLGRFQDLWIQMHIDTLLCMMMHVWTWVKQIFRMIYGRHLGEIFDSFVTIEEIWPKPMLNKFILIGTIYCSKDWVQALFINIQWQLLHSFIIIYKGKSKASISYISQKKISLSYTLLISMKISPHLLSIETDPSSVDGSSYDLLVHVASVQLIVVGINHLIVVFQQPVLLLQMFCLDFFCQVFSSTVRPS